MSATESFDKFCTHLLVWNSYFSNLVLTEMSDSGWGPSGGDGAGGWGGAQGGWNGSQSGSGGKSSCICEDISRVMSIRGDTCSC